MVAIIFTVLFVAVIISVINGYSNAIIIKNGDVPLSERGVSEYECEIELLGEKLPCVIYYEAERGDVSVGVPDSVCIHDLLIKRDYVSNRELEWALLEQLRFESIE